MSSVSQVTAVQGGVPTISLDVAVLSVFIALFVCLAIGHMTLFQVNRRRGHKFIFNGLFFGFAMSRIVACIFRLIWATQPTNTDISLVAAIFLNAGILLVYIINSFFAWRMVRSSAPSFGWNPIVRWVNRVMLFLVPGFLIPFIVILVLRIKSPTRPHVQEASKILSRIVLTYFLVIAVQPLFLLAFAMTKGPKDAFGRGSWNGKALVLLISTILAVIEAAFRCGTNWTTAPLATNPAWWDSKAAFYCFNFTLDVCILLNALIWRVDQRFWVPNAADGPMSYSTTEGTTRVDKDEESMKKISSSSASEEKPQ